jgi:hypothetical protein
MIIDVGDLRVDMARHQVTLRGQADPPDPDRICHPVHPDAAHAVKS